MAGGCACDSRQPVPGLLREARARVEHHPQAGKEGLGELFIGLKRFDKPVVPCGHVEIPGSGDLTQILNGGLKAICRGFAVVNVVGAAVGQHHVGDFVSGGRVVPWRPVKNDRGLGFEEPVAVSDHSLIGGDHAVGVDHSLG